MRRREKGEFTSERRNEILQEFGKRKSFQFDRNMPSGRVVATYARPTREGGFVVTFTDVTTARRSAAELAKAKKAAEAAEAQARQILQEERARRTVARSLADLDEWLQSCKSLDELFQIVTTFMGRLIPDSRGELYLYSNSRDMLDGACEWGQADSIRPQISADCCWSLRCGRAYAYDPDALCFPCHHLSDEVKEAPGQYVCIPVIAHGDTVGLMHISFGSGTSAAEMKSLGQFATRAAEHISMAIANVKLRDELHDQSIRDPLTGLYNRRYFMEAMRREVASADADKGGAGFGLISFDADHFKAFNDNHGHDSGDMVLRAIAECMYGVMPAEAVHARLGGEEFAILLPGETGAALKDRAEAFRAAVAGTEVRTAYGVLPKITISAGILSYQGEGRSPTKLLKLADEALYRAKHAGRNQVETA